ncbi:MAG: hypothetical protein RIQ33_1945 [Bacteroidota bacterium]|jgi:hypothetical protein
MKRIYIILFAAASIAMASCSTSNISMREPNAHVEFYKTDFTFSEQFSAEAVESRILGIDFSRLFKKTTGTVQRDGGAQLFSIPVIGSYIQNPTSSYALYNLMSDHKGYDVVFYPQYETVVERPIIGLPIFVKTTVTVTARLAKIKKGGAASSDK